MSGHSSRIIKCFVHTTMCNYMCQLNNKLKNNLFSWSGVSLFLFILNMKQTKIMSPSSVLSVHYKTCPDYFSKSTGVISNFTAMFSPKSNGPFLTVKRSMFTEIEVANQWHCRAHYNLCPTLHKRTCAFC